MTIAWTDSDLAYHTQMTNAFTHSEDSFCDEEGKENPAFKKINEESVLVAGFGAAAFS